jgi:NAD(P)H-hydrate epimerase
MNDWTLVTAEQMRAIDRYTIDTLGIPALVLMENAGREVAGAVRNYADAKLKTENPGQRPSVCTGRRWLVLVGKGNNGGDGLVAARHLHEWGFDVLIVYAEHPDRLRGDAAVQRNIAERLGLKTEIYRPGALDWSRWDGIVDALLGTGAKGSPREPYASLIREADASGLPCIAVDIPSGLDADNGSVYSPHIRADLTVCLAFAKAGVSQYPGAEAAGRVIVAPIGIPAALAEQFGVRTFVITDDSIRARLGVDPALPRPADTHKGTYGHVLVAAGSRPMSGAGLMAVRAALRAGCGLATWALPERVADAVAGRVPEAMLAAMPDGGSGDWSRVPTAALAALASSRDALVIGPGCGRFAGDSEWLRELWERCPGPMVLDADALNMLADAGDFAGWPRRDAAVLTPHPGEMARLAGLSVREVQHDRIGLARQFAVRHGVTLVLKGARTVVAAPDGEVFVNLTGNPGMATGGAGDVLAGMIGSLLAQRLDPKAAAVIGVMRHGAAGDRAAAARNNEASVLAGDIIDYL